MINWKRNIIITISTAILMFLALFYLAKEDWKTSLFVAVLASILTYLFERKRN